MEEHPASELRARSREPADEGKGHTEEAELALVARHCVRHPRRRGQRVRQQADAGQGAGLELRRQRCRTVVKNPNRLVSSGPGTPPLPIHDDKSGHIRGVRWNGGGTGTYLPETYGLHGVLATHRCDRDLGAFQLTRDLVSSPSRPRLNQSRESGSSQTPTIRPSNAWIRVAV
jgi:hypothetical protein